MSLLTPSEEKALEAVAKDIGANSKQLYDLINFESKWNPQAKNPNSSARGLIQFIDSTARGLGYPGGSAELISKHPTRISQLQGPVRQYLKPYGPFPTKQSLYMAVFYPVARTWSLTKEFPAAVQKVNPGIKTVGDYVAYVEKRSGEYNQKGVMAASLSPVGLLLLLSLLFSKIWKRK